ncbi:alpha/beta fold hydrolase [Chromobacterium haemolyticum]|uniref:alpha/beta fold hydrolase n=1 Tax=Chromobacterium haemolyticum TaxID=394935 RepID=UPI0013171E86|nr:alpha/beta fold hydrolase [Chromobacterium haemolyticum]BBH12849.1 hypothetical protein CH06BL_20970 [Chromobacterium haemolyticum]
MHSSRIQLPDGEHTVVEWHGASEQAPQGVILFLPALGVNVSYYRALGAAWAARGYCVAAAEIRGMRQSSVRDVRCQDFGYREVLADVAHLRQQLSEQTSGRPLILAGHSLGGQFALLQACENPAEVAGVALLAGGSNYFRAMPGALSAWKRGFGLRLIQQLNRSLGYFPGDKLGFGGRQPGRLIRDWTQEALHGRYRLENSDADYEAALRRLELPVLLLSLSGDRFVPRSCADFLADKLARASVTQRELQAADHGLRAFSHFAWAKTPQPVLDAFQAWRERLPNAAT